MDFFDIEIKLKSYLNLHKIRLCDEPFTSNGEKGSGIKTLSEKISTEISYKSTIIEEVLNDLRKKAISTISTISKFKENKICSIKVHQPKERNDLIVEIDDLDSETGLLFRERLCQILKIHGTGMKIIFKGKFINDTNLLKDFGIKNNSKVLVMNLTENDFQTNDTFSSIDEGRKMADYLSQRSIDCKFKSSSMEVEITNQSGQVLHLTNEQKSSITYGLTMHKQATNYILKGQYNIALLYCLEAEDAFMKSNYCDEVDNIAILQLDIVWCYFCLQNVDDISESKKRLEICEKRMTKCYGEGNERIQRIREKATFEGVPEGVHIFRLYLLKGILSYYENDSVSATSHLNKAFDLYHSWTVPDDLIAQVMHLGFSREQAIDGLRVNKNVTIAVEYIMRRAEDLKALEINEAEFDKNKSIIKRLGFTKNKSKIDLSTLKILNEQSHMHPSLCLAALKRSNNHYNEALELVFNNEEELWKDVSSARENGNVFDGDFSYDAVQKEMNAVKQIKQFVNQEISVIKKYLRQCDGNIDAALNVLLNIEIEIVEDISSSPSSSNSFENNNEDTNRAKLEESIYNTIGEGSSKSPDVNYFNPDLFNEITAFNKFANLLNLPLISSINHNLNCD